MRLGFDQDFAFEADLVLVLDDHRQEAAEILKFARQIRVQKRVIAFTATPEDIILAAQTMRRLKTITYLAHGAGRHFRIRIGQATGGVARVAEKVCGAPEQFDAGLFLVSTKSVACTLEIVREFVRRCGGLGDVHIMEAVIGKPQFREEFKSRCHLRISSAAVIGRVLPRAIKRACAENVEAVPAEGVPVAHRHAQVVFHALSKHHLVLVVIAIGKRVLAFRPLKLDRGDVAEDRILKRHSICVSHSKLL